MSSQNGLPRQLYRAEQVRALDSGAIHEFAIAGIKLMRRAGQFSFDQLLARWPNARGISVWCGAGNNGGDGYVVAGLAQQRGLAVQLVQVGDEAKLSGDAALACQWARESGVEFTPWSESVAVCGDVIVDALLGTGLKQALRAPFDQAVVCINSSDTPVLAVDIPSGLCSDTGCVLGDAVGAELTTTFVGLKQGLFTAQGPLCCGDLVFDDLAVPAAVYERESVDVVRLDASWLSGAFPPRQRDAHKGHFGHVLVVGGNLGMGGAAIMTAQAAARVGAGLVSVATQPQHLAALLTRCPEIMAHGVTEKDMLRELLPGKSAVVVGPGMGQDSWSRQMLEAVLENELQAEQPLVLDADALNLLCGTELTSNAAREQQPNWILTPHPGEAARLLRCSVGAIQTDRFAAVRALQQCYGGIALLKGLGSLVAGAGPEIALCDAGNPGMASGGMGDVLSGILAGLLAQGFELEQATRLAVVLHAAAADRAAEAGERGMLATDLLPYLRELVNPE